MSERSEEGGVNPNQDIVPKFLDFDASPQLTGVINLKVIFRLSSILEEVVESVCLISPHKTVNRDFLSKGGMDFVIWIKTELKFSSFFFFKDFQCRLAVSGSEKCTVLGEGHSWRSCKSCLPAKGCCQKQKVGKIDIALLQLSRVTSFG